MFAESERLKFTSTGSDPNFVSIITLNFVVNANGDLTVADAVSEVRCD